MFRLFQLPYGDFGGSFVGAGSAAGMSVPEAPETATLLDDAMLSMIELHVLLHLSTKDLVKLASSCRQLHALVMQADAHVWTTAASSILHSTHPALASASASAICAALKQHAQARKNLASGNHSCSQVIRGASCPAISPCGKFLAVISTGNCGGFSLQVWDVQLTICSFCVSLGPGVEVLPPASTVFRYQFPIRPFQIRWARDSSQVVLVHSLVDSQVAVQTFDVQSGTCTGATTLSPRKSRPTEYSMELNPRLPITRCARVW